MTTIIHQCKPLARLLLASLGAAVVANQATGSIWVGVAAYLVGFFTLGGE